MYDGMLFPLSDLVIFGDIHLYKNMSTTCFEYFMPEKLFTRYFAAILTTFTITIEILHLPTNDIIIYLAVY